MNETNGTVAVLILRKDGTVQIEWPIDRSRSYPPNPKMGPEIVKEVAEVAFAAEAVWGGEA